MILTPVDVDEAPVIPEVFVRIHKPNGIRRQGDARRQGEIRTDLRPVAIDRHPGPEGGVLVLRPLANALASSPDDMVEDFDGAIAEVEIRRDLTGRSMRQVLFRGRYLAKDWQFGAGQNGCDLHFGDWEILNDNVLRHNFGANHLGFALKYMDNLPHLWPRDHNGNKLARIDPDLFSAWNMVGDIPLQGQPIGAAFCDLLSRRREWIPDIDYSEGQVVLTGRKRGARELDLVIGPVNVDEPDPDYFPNTMEISGTEDVARRINRITALGGLSLKRDVTDLTPAWDRTLDAEFLADPNEDGQGDDDPLRDVGRVFLIDGDFWPVNGEPVGPVAKSERPKIYARPTEDDEYFPIEEENAPIFLTREQLYERTGRTFLYPESLYYFDTPPNYVVFKEPILHRYYTEEEHLTRLGGTVVSEHVVFPQLQLQAMRMVGRLTADTGYVGDSMVERRRIHTNERYIRISTGTFYRDIGDSREIATDVSDRNDSLILLYEARSIVDKTRHPTAQMRVILPYFDFALQLGDRITRILDSEGTVIREGLQWDVEGIQYRLIQSGGDYGRTVLSLSQDLQSIWGGLVLQ